MSAGRVPRVWTTVVLVAALALASWGAASAVSILRLQERIARDDALLGALDRLEQSAMQIERHCAASAWDESGLERCNELVGDARRALEQAGAQSAGATVVPDWDQTAGQIHARLNRIETLARTGPSAALAAHAGAMADRVRRTSDVVRARLVGGALDLSSSLWRLSALVVLATLLAMFVALLLAMLGRTIGRLRDARLALHQTEARLATLVNAAPVVLFGVDRNGTVALIEGKGLDSLGLGPGQLVGRTVHEAFAEAPQLVDCFERALAGEAVSSTVTFRGQTLETLQAPIHGEDGRVSGVLGVATNVTDRRLAEEAVRTSERRYRALSELTSDFVFTCRVEDDGRIVLDWTNDAFATTTGFTVEQLASKGGWRRLVHPDDRAQSEHDAEQLLRGSAVMGVRRILTRPGLARWVHVAIRPTSDEGGQGVTRLIGAARDVTEQRQAEQSLRQSEERYRRLVEQSPDAIIVHLSGKIVFTNLAGADLLGADRPAQLLGRRVLDLIHPDYLDLERERIERVYAGQDAVPLIEERYLRLDGTPVDVEVASTSCVYLGRRAAQVVARDISGRKRAQRRQTLMLRELDHRVKNNLAAIVSIAEQTLRDATDLDSFGSAFLGRVRALASLHDLLARGGADGADLERIVCQCVQSYRLGPTQDVRIRGPRVALPRRIASTLTMTVHELATNAAKYGSLSVPAGRVSVQWDVRPTDQHPRTLVLDWTERGGPSVREDRPSGFGTELIRTALKYECQGVVDLLFKPEGVVCRISVPLPERQTAPRVKEPGDRAVDMSGPT